MQAKIAKNFYFRTLFKVRSKQDFGFFQGSVYTGLTVYGFQECTRNLSIGFIGPYFNMLLWLISFSNE